MEWRKCCRTVKKGKQRLAAKGMRTNTNNTKQNENSSRRSEWVSEWVWHKSNKETNNNKLRSCVCDIQRTNKTYWGRQAQQCKLKRTTNKHKQSKNYYYGERVRCAGKTTNGQAKNKINLNKHNYFHDKISAIKLRTVGEFFKQTETKLTTFMSWFFFSENYCCPPITP